MDKRISTFCSVFDVNVYRALVRKASPDEAVSRARRLVARERAADIIGLGSHGVLTEILGHLASEDDPDFDVSVAALCAFVIHTSKAEDGLGRLRLVPQPEQQLCNPIFGDTPGLLTEISKSLRQGAHAAFADPTRSAVLKNAPGYEIVAKVVRETEAEYVAMMQKCIDDLDLSAKGSRSILRQLLLGEEGRTMAAQVLVHRAKVAMGRKDIAAGDDYCAAYIREAFPGAIDFMVDRLQRLLDGAKPENDANSYWDGEFAYLLGQTCTGIDGESFEAKVPILLVTGDSALRGTASRCSLEDRCVSWSRYKEILRLLGTDTVAGSSAQS